MPLTPAEQSIGEAVDLAAFEQYLQQHLRPRVESFLDAIDSSDWADLIEGSFNRLAIMIALAQLAPSVPALEDLGQAIVADADHRLGEILIGLAVRPGS